MKYGGQPQYFGRQPIFLKENGRRPEFCWRQPRELIFVMQHCFNPTKWNIEIDLILLKMDDHIILFENGRQMEEDLFFFVIEDYISFCKW